MSKLVKMVEVDELYAVANEDQTQVLDTLIGKVHGLRAEAQKQRSAGQRERQKVALAYYKEHGPKQA